MWFLSQWTESAPSSLAISLFSLNENIFSKYYFINNAMVSSTEVVLFNFLLTFYICKPNPPMYLPLNVYESCVLRLNLIL